MKKCMILLLVLVLLLSAGCSKQESAPTQAPSAETTLPEETTQETTAPPTTEETVPVPELGTGFALLDETPAILEMLMRGDIVDLAGEYDQDHYVIKTDKGYGLVKKELLRNIEEAAYESWIGYAYYNAEVYSHYRLVGQAVQQLAKNTKVQVLDDLGYCYVVQVDQLLGYMDKAGLAKAPISSGGSTGADGGDINLQFQGGINLLSTVDQVGEVTGQAEVLADWTEVVLGYFDRGQEIPTVAEEGFAQVWDGYVTVYLNGLYAYVPQSLLVTGELQAYQEWTGYSRWNTEVFDNHYLLGEPIQTLHTNAQVRVLEELEGCYLVEVNGSQGYVGKDMISASKFSTGGGGDEWSPPAM